MRQRSMGFSPREGEILSLVAGGLADKEIAASLGISPRTVSAYLDRIYLRHSIHTRTQAVVMWLRSPSGEGHLNASK